MRYSLWVFMFTAVAFVAFSLPQFSQEAGNPNGDTLSAEKLDIPASLLPGGVILSGNARLEWSLFCDFLKPHLKPDTLELINDLIKDGGRFERRWRCSTIQDLIKELSQTFEDSISFALRPGDVEESPASEKPPRPDMALFLKIKDMKRLQTMEKTVRETQNSDRLSYSLWKMTHDIHGCGIKGINSAGSDPSEIIAYTVLEDRYLILATSSRFILDMLKTRERK